MSDQTMSRGASRVAHLEPEWGNAASAPAGGQWEGRVVIAPDFDLLPDDIQEAFGMQDS